MNDLERLRAIADGEVTETDTGHHGIVAVGFSLKGHRWQCQYDDRHRALYAFQPQTFPDALSALEALVKGGET